MIAAKFSATSRCTRRMVVGFLQARVLFVFEVRDLWPESLSYPQSVWAATNRKTICTLAKIAGFLYGKANRIVVVTAAFKDHLIKHWNIPSEKISVIENGVENHLFSPQNTNA